jgi:hypothetical protein
MHCACSTDLNSLPPYNQVTDKHCRTESNPPDPRCADSNQFGAPKSGTPIILIYCSHAHELYHAPRTRGPVACSHSSRRDQDLSAYVPRSRPRQLARCASGRTSLSSASAAGSRVSWRTLLNPHKESGELPTATKTIDLRTTFIGDDRSSDDVRWIRSIFGRRSADRTKDLLGRHGQSRRDCW